MGVEVAQRQRLQLFEHLVPQGALDFSGRAEDKAAPPEAAEHDDSAAQDDPGRDEQDAPGVQTVGGQTVRGLADETGNEQLHVVHDQKREQSHQICRRVPKQQRPQHARSVFQLLHNTLPNALCAKGVNHIIRQNMPIHKGKL